MSHPRRLWASLSFLLLALASPSGPLVGDAAAKAAFARGQSPGWYRVWVGDFELTALLDGTVSSLPIEKMLTNISPAKVEAAFAKNFQKPPIELSINAFLINTGAKLVLVDAGTGTLFGPSLGKVVANLKASGYQPEQVDEIYITHMHVDHVGSLTANGKASFPNAILRAAKAEGEQWLSEANAAKAPYSDKEAYAAIAAALNPYLTSGKYKPFEGKTELISQSGSGPAGVITAIPAPGHTEGHTVYVVESKGQKLALWGDLVHVLAVQFAEPGVGIIADTIAKKAIAERKKLFAEAAKQGYLVATAHMPFPGFGHLRTEGRGFRFVPANYTANNTAENAAAAAPAK